MIFQHTWEKVLNGTKTQTRRLVKGNEELFNRWDTEWWTETCWAFKQEHHENPRQKCEGVYICGEMLDDGRNGWEYEPSPPVYDWRLKWGIGRTYAVQPGRTKKTIGRIKLTGIRQERLQAITEIDAMHEGCDPEMDEHGNIILFPKTVYARLWDTIHTAPGTRWADNPLVWVLEFELVKEIEHP